MKRHANIPIFIPHLGCPNNCVFCNQRTITGVGEFDVDSVKSEIDNALSTIGDDCEVEIAFFGGSFTGIDRALMCNLLDIAYSYVISGAVKSVRCSTRPDYISEQILDILKAHGVKTVELGLQSCSDKVLLLTKRGHTRQDEEKACRIIVESGIELVGQMMIGLPGSTLESELETAQFIADMGATSARIYPTVVFRETELCSMAQSGNYTPLSLGEAVKRSAAVLKLLRARNISVIRIGLCASENLSSESTYYAGPNHAALGELVENEYYLGLIKEEVNKIQDRDTEANITVAVSRGALSKAIGQRKSNIIQLSQEFPNAKIRILEDASVGLHRVKVIVEKGHRDVLKIT